MANATVEQGESRRLPFETAYRRLGYSRSTAYKRYWDGEFPCKVKKDGARLWVSARALERAIEGDDAEPDAE